MAYCFVTHAKKTKNMLASLYCLLGEILDKGTKNNHINIMRDTSQKSIPLSL